MLFEMLLFPLLTAYLVRGTFFGLGSLIDLQKLLENSFFLEFLAPHVLPAVVLTKFTLGIWDKWEVVLFLTILIVVGILFERRKMTIKKKACFRYSAILALLIEVPYHWETELVMVDVEQGDSILLLAPGGIRRH